MIHKIYYICNIYLMYTQYNRYIYVLRYTVSQIYSHPNFFHVADLPILLT